jgi:geranylgeranyl pyrophosphate synthase
MKARVPSSENEIPKINRDKRNFDYELRSWEEVARIYTANTGETMNAKLAEHVHARAIKKLRVLLDKSQNSKLSELLNSELD